MLPPCSPKPCFGRPEVWLPPERRKHGLRTPSESKVAHHVPVLVATREPRRYGCPLPMPLKVYLQSLGCPKNLVDSETMLGLLVREGAEIVLDPAAADVCVVNTCAFIGPAKQESIN